MKDEPPLLALAKALDLCEPRRTPKEGEIVNKCSAARVYNVMHRVALSATRRTLVEEKYGNNVWLHSSTKSNTMCQPLCQNRFCSFYLCSSVCVSLCHGKLHYLSKLRLPYVAPQRSGPKRSGLPTCKRANLANPANVASMQ